MVERGLEDVSLPFGDSNLDRLYWMATSEPVVMGNVLCTMEFFYGHGQEIARYGHELLNYVQHLL